MLRVPSSTEFELLSLVGGRSSIRMRAQIAEMTVRAHRGEHGRPAHQSGPRVLPHTAAPPHLAIKEQGFGIPLSLAATAYTHQGQGAALRDRRRHHQGCTVALRLRPFRPQPAVPALAAAPRGRAQRGARDKVHALTRAAKANKHGIAAQCRGRRARDKYP